jgi:hypothetical protein
MKDDIALYSITSQNLLTIGAFQILGSAVMRLRFANILLRQLPPQRLRGMLLHGVVHISSTVDRKSNCKLTYYIDIRHRRTKPLRFASRIGQGPTIRRHMAA